MQTAQRQNKSTLTEFCQTPNWFVPKGENVKNAASWIKLFYRGLTYLSRRSLTLRTSVENSSSITGFFFRSSHTITEVRRLNIYNKDFSTAVNKYIYIHVINTHKNLYIILNTFMGIYTIILCQRIH